MKNRDERSQFHFKQTEGDEFLVSEQIEVGDFPILPQNIIP